MALSKLRQFSRGLTVCLLLASFGVHPALPAETHVVNPADLQKEMVSAARSRQQNRETIGAFLSSPTAQKALNAARIDLKQVTAAIAGLSDEDLARLAARAESTQKDFAAGRISDRDLLIILIGIAALILIIVAVD